MISDYNTKYEIILKNYMPVTAWLSICEKQRK